MSGGAMAATEGLLAGSVSLGALLEGLIQRLEARLGPVEGLTGQRDQQSRSVRAAHTARPPLRARLRPTRRSSHRSFKIDYSVTLSALLTENATEQWIMTPARCSPRRRDGRITPGRSTLPLGQPDRIQPGRPVRAGSGNPCPSRSAGNEAGTAPAPACAGAEPGTPAGSCSRSRRPGPRPPGA